MSFTLTTLCTATQSLVLLAASAAVAARPFAGSFTTQRQREELLNLFMQVVALGNQNTTMIIWH